MKRLFLFILWMMLSVGIANTQSKSKIVPEVEDLLAKENYSQAASVVKERIALLQQLKKLDSLVGYVTYLGKVTEKLQGKEAAETTLLSLLKELRQQFPYHPKLIAATLKAAHFISTSGNHQLAYQTVASLEKYIQGHQGAMQKEEPNLYFGLGDFAVRLGNTELASQHYKHSIALLKKIPNPDKEQLVIANNSMGIIMHFASKADSSSYYWEKALKMAYEMDTSDAFVYYRRSSIENNLSNAYSYLGKQKDALNMLEQSIKNNKKFIESKEPHPSKKQAAIYTLYSMDNIGKIYLDLGDFTKALDVYTYAYQSKLRLFEKDNFEIAKAKVFLATVYNDKHQYHAAKQYAADALRILKLKGDTANSWDAGANTQLAYACRYLKQTHLATLYYEEAYRLNKIASGEKYNEFFFGFIEGLAIFYGENNQSQKAIALAKNALMKAIQSQGEQSPVAIRQMQTLSKAYLVAKDFTQAEKQALKATHLVDQLLSKAQNTTDSISLEIVKAKLILTEAKAQYYQLSIPDTVVVKRILQQLEQAVGIMEHRMTIFSDQTDINLLIANNKDLTDFIKQLQYTLFELSSNKEYIKQLINLHEATLYTKIRSRLNKQNALQFLNLPDSVRQMEDKLKANLQLTSNAKAVQQTSTNYLQAIHQWNAFIESLKTHYPKYYQLRYAPFDFSLDELHHHIPNDVTVLRYVMVENNLFVLVLSQKQPPIMLPLSSKDLKEKVIALNGRNSKPQEVCSLSHSLYRQLWQPIEKYIQYKRIVIVPDGILFNVSFDMLATKQVTTYADLAKHTLLQQYPISYQYSLAAMQFESTVTKMKSNYIAFAPVFSSEDKLSYKRSMQQDSLHLDKTYLNLLPLPFTLNLVEKVKSMLGGKLYTNKEATTSSFKTQAAHHHIIHLGTHAESNNDYPEYSRLLFAKEPSQISDDNSLYLYDIYNCDITSDLTVLAACESGKPGYQDGEGMISLAHAFKYAGSQAIMTALWRIDEQSSTQIIEQFYKNLKKGMSKDVALQQAKITYLQQASGRSLSPAYWGGLVILGDPNAIELNDAYDFSYWIEAIIFLAAIFLTWFIISRKSSSSTV